MEVRSCRSGISAAPVWQLSDVATADPRSRADHAMHDGEQEPTVVKRERDTAIEEARETRQSHVATLQTIQNLETEAQTREEDLRSLQQRYDHVDQENRRLMYEMGNIGVARSVE